MADDDGNKGDYEIGYGKPPKHTQWKPGQSGNAQGKKSDAPSFKLAIRRELEARIAITDSGGRYELRAYSGDRLLFNSSAGTQATARVPWSSADVERIGQHLPGLMPDNTPPGVEVLFQVWIMDSGAPYDYSATNSLKGTTQ